ncbi:hypothetical protein ACVIU4_009904 [Bradyrhizobium barranii subsp. barranii]|nr:hypothetical protein [Bradyrhizobium japonicum]MCP1962099.1 hypothetical protein [Bradyrhizobium japonicum]
MDSKNLEAADLTRDSCGSMLRRLVPKNCRH